MAVSIAGVTALVSQAVTAPVIRVANGVAYVGRVSGKMETLVDEMTQTVRAARPVVTAVGKAVDDGIIDDFVGALHKMDSTLSLVGRVSTQIEQTLPRLDTTVRHIGTTLPLVDRTTKAVRTALPDLAQLPSTQQEVRMAREAVQHLVGLVNATLDQLDTLPGAKAVRRRMDMIAAGNTPGPDDDV